MSSHEAEPAASAPKVPNQSKLLTILAGGAFALSLITMVIAVLILLKPSVADKIEQGNGEIKEAIETNGTSLTKAMAGMRDACIDWQAVLKASSDKPDAIFKIVKSPDGFLNLTEIQGGAADAAGEGRFK